MISKEDLAELRRVSTNAFDRDRRFTSRIINEINKMSKEIILLKKENQKLKDELEGK